MSDTVDMNGTVEDLFGHRFTMTTDEGKVLVDLGPGGDRGVTVAAGQSVAVKGERKPGEFKAQGIRIADGEWQQIEAGDKHPPKPHDKAQDKSDDKAQDTDQGDAEPSDEQVTRMLDEAGYTDHAERTRKPKHVEAIATKDGQRHKVHVHKDGVKKTEAVA